MEYSQSNTPDSTQEQLEQIRARCGARMPLDDFVAIVSNAYHELESPFYDTAHPELFQYVAPAMEDFLPTALSFKQGKTLRTLDAGCGTGFASAVLMKKAGSRIGELVCADPSPHMLDQCRRKLRGHSNVSYRLGGIEALGDQQARFDLVITSSMLHHIVQVADFLARLLPLVAPGGFYLMLHEPSRRFYRNPECMRLLAKCSAKARRRPLSRYVDPRAYVRALRRVIRWRGLDSIQQQTSRRLHRRGVTQNPLREEEISVLVDVHAPPLRSDAWPSWQGGFDIDELRGGCLSALSLLALRSYGFLGPLYENQVPKRCRQEAQQLAERFPDDGAMFCALWRKA